MTASINNYTVGKGIVSFRKEGAGAYADMGNCTEFEFTPELEKLDHFSSREGVRTKDKSIVIQKSGTVRLVLDEWTRDNIALAVLGTNAIVGGQSITEIFDSNAIKGALKFTGTNEVGPKYEWVFPAVEFVPSSSISLLSDEWGTIELTGDVLISGGSFGTITALGESVPVNTVLPSIAGIAQEGEPLVAIVGEWSGIPGLHLPVEERRREHFWRHQCHLHAGHGRCRRCAECRGHRHQCRGVGHRRRRLQPQP